MKTILVIEGTGNAISRSIISVLQDSCIESHNNTDLALKRIIKNHFDLIIIDADIPCNKTVDIRKLLRTAAISGKPVIVVSKFNMWNLVKLGLNYYSNKINENIRYLFNPFKDSLQSTIKEMINIKPIESSVMFNRLMEPMNGLKHE